MNPYKMILSLSIALFLMAGCGEGKKDYTDRMAEEHAEDTPTANESARFEPTHEVTSEIVLYADQEGNEIAGYKAEPVARTDDTPGIIVIHEWWGLNENIEMMTRRLAGEGYVALAVDLYGGETAGNAEGAQKLMREAMENPEAATDNLRQAYSYLNGEEGLENIAVIGWCFGGGWSLNTTLDMPEQIDAAVIYYGQLNTDPEELATLDMPVLGIFGAEDQGIPVENVNRFEEVLDSLGKDADIHIYEGADHAFANPSGNRYNAEAAADAWEKTVAFLNEHLKMDN